MHSRLSNSTLLSQGLTLIVMLFIANQAFAHAEVGVAGGLMSGFLHPIYGPDHMLAMIAVGLWGAQLDKPAIWVLPITFPIVMAIGGLMGVTGIPLPMVELGIALSALALGTAVALQWKANLIFAAVIVGLFAIFHGHAHGTELPSAANPLAYGVGFVISTGLLHALGILIGYAIRWPMGNTIVRILGAVIAVLGIYFVLGAIGVL